MKALDRHGGSRRAVAAACLLAAVGGTMDAWVYLGHGRVLANAQTGNVVLGALALADGRPTDAMRHLPPLAAFCLGVLGSRLGATYLKRRGANSRSARLLSVAALLGATGAYAGGLPDGAVTALMGFIAALQITAMSHVDGWSFNTGMTTGNLVSAISAAGAAWVCPADRDTLRRALALGSICVSFAAGATVGAIATMRWGDPALIGAAAVAVIATALIADVADPVP